MAIGDWSAIGFTPVDIGGLGCDQENHQVGALLDTGASADFTLRMYSINSSGGKVPLGDQTYSIGYAGYTWLDTPRSLFHIRDSIWAVQGTMILGADYLLMICTVEADGSGFKPGILDYYVITNDRPYTETKRHARITEDIYAFPYTATASETRLTTLQIDSDGTITHLDTEVLSSLYTSQAVCCLVYDNILVVGTGQPRIDTVSVDTTTGIITPLAYSTTAATYYYCSDLFPLGLNSDEDAMIMASLSSSGPTGKLETFEISLDGNTIGVNLASVSLGDGGNRGQCGGIYIGVGSSDYYLLWGARDIGDWDIDIGSGYVTQSGGITWVDTQDGIWALASGGGPNLVTMHRAWSNPNGDDKDIYIISSPVGLGAIWAETYLVPEIYSVSPDEGKQGKSYAIVVTGKYFTGATDVDFGLGITIDSYTVDSDTQITVNISIAPSASIGPHDISVTASGGTGTLENGFEVLPGVRGGAILDLISSLGY